MAEQNKEKDKQEVGVLLPEKKHKNALDKLAARLDLSPKMLSDTLRATAFNLCKDEAQFVAAVVVANTYGLNPILREMTAFPGKSGGVVPVVMIDGWIKLVNRQETYNGMKFIDNLLEGEKVNKSGTNMDSVTVEFYIKGRDFPIVVTEYMDECFDPSKEPWKRWPRRMLRHKAFIQGARVAFGFSGIYDEDEKDRIIAAEDAVVITDPVIELKGDKNKKPIPGQEKVAEAQAELVEDPTEFMQVGNLGRFGESAAKAKFIADSILACGQKLGKEQFMAVVGAAGVTKVTEIAKFEDLVKLSNTLLEEVKKLEQQ